MEPRLDSWKVQRLAAKAVSPKGHGHGESVFSAQIQNGTE